LPSSTVHFTNSPLRSSSNSIIIIIVIIFIAVAVFEDALRHGRLHSAPRELAQKLRAFHQTALVLQPPSIQQSASLSLSSKMSSV
jgi:Tfp pilus assembly protein FimT